MIHFNSMNTLDFFILIPVVLGFILGLFKGLIKELISLAAIVLGIYGAKIFAPVVSGIFVKSFDMSPKTATPVAYLVLFITIIIGMLILANMLNKLFDSLALGGLNKFLGGIFGGLKFALVVSVLLNVFDALDSKFPIINPETKEASIGYKPFIKLGPTLWDEIKNNNTIETAIGNKDGKK